MRDKTIRARVSAKTLREVRRLANERSLSIAELIRHLVMQEKERQDGKGETKAEPLA